MVEIMKSDSLYKCGTLVEVNQQKRGKVVTVGCAPKRESDAPVVTPAPALGADTDAVRKEVGYTDADIAKFRADHVVCK